MRALVVDDSGAMRLVLRQMLEELGFDVLEAADGFDALERLAESGPFDLALVDWYMPNMDGLELVRQMRGDAKLAGVRIVMVTTETGRERVALALDAGADEYVMKPFNRDILVEKLALAGLEVG